MPNETKLIMHRIQRREDGGKERRGVCPLRVQNERYPQWSARQGHENAEKKKHLPVNGKGCRWREERGEGTDEVENTPRFRLHPQQDKGEEKGKTWNGDL